ncbi:MAG TPA: DUF2264 domain-containing protein [Anaerolineales bacterium]|nr:DUF2264 domain-containing protein [Anaerolineales bacterium]
MDPHPSLDFARSPYTGWTRAHWVQILARMTHGFALAAEITGSPARALYPDDRRGLPDSVDGLESFARIAAAWGAWLRNPTNPARLRFHDRELDVEQLLRRGLLEGTDPANARTYWGDMTHMDQRIVESADLAVALWMSRARVFDRLSPAEQTQILAWLGQVDDRGTYPDNWILFTAVTQAVRLRLGHPAPVVDLDVRLQQACEFYRGDGWYVDGPANEYELYNAWMFNWHFLLWAWIDGDRRPEIRQRVLERARSFIAGFTHFFGANGSYPAWGRSLVYRFAALAAFATGHLLGVAPADPGGLRRLSSGCLKYFDEHGLFDADRHFVRQGYHGDFPAAGEPYLSPGSPYWCSHGLFALTFDEGDAFWTAPEGPLPVERGDYEIVLPAPGFVVSGRQATGQVLLLNSRSGQEHDAPRYHYAAKYGKFVYSTHFPFNVVAAHGSPAPDAMVALTRDGQAFGHRVRTRDGAAAPGLIWCKYEELIDGEPQPMWAAVLLWQDLQVRLAHIRPTFPVRAFEAPGALGTERPTAIVRRSDGLAGWEYAEAEGRALGIRRLLGYDGQLASAPFRDQSNLNLAYRYAEQPMMMETQPSVAARTVAAVSLVRPASYDPEIELDGFAVAPEGVDGFEIRFPDGGAAWLALAETLPTTTTVAEVAIDGIGLRYARVSADRGDVCGLGVTRVAGIAEFAEPTAFRLRRAAEGSVRVATATGVALSPDWLGGAAHRVEVLTLSDDWVDVTRDCGASAISGAVVRHWAERHERTLVDFRVSR